MNEIWKRTICVGSILFVLLLIPSFLVYGLFVGDFNSDKTLVERSTKEVTMNPEILNKLMEDRNVTKIVIQKSLNKVIYTEESIRVISCDTKKFYFTVLILIPTIFVSMAIMFITYTIHSNIDTKEAISAIKRYILCFIAYSLILSAIAVYATYSVILVGTLLIFLAFSLLLGIIPILMYYKEIVIASKTL